LQRYPDYELRIREYFSNGQSEPFRFCAAASILKNSDKKKILFISHSLGGGTQKHCEDLADYIKDSAHIINLNIHANDIVDLSFKIDDYKFTISLDINESLFFLCDFLKSCGLDRVHIHHLMGSGESFMRFLRNLDIPFDLTIHDYYIVCPRANFSRNGSYCGEPSEAEECFNCLSQEPLAETQDILTWRFNRLWILQAAIRVICPSNDVAARISKYYSGDNIFVVPHEEISSIPIIKFKKNNPNKLHLAIIGWLFPHKGLNLIRDIIKHIESESLPILITLIGSSNGSLSNSMCYNELGPYKEVELNRILKSVSADMFLLPSTVPETFSYTLSHAMRTGKPIIASKIGAYVERLEEYPHFELFSLSDSVSDIVQKILKFSKELEYKQ
jgi:glycosyltransferase involved in cell wall biosynthesis